MHLRQLPSGRWRAIVKANGRQRTATADKRTEAQRLGAQLLLSLGGTPIRGRATVGDIIAALDANRAQRWSPTYRADVRAVIDRIPTSFLDTRATTIRPRDIDTLYVTLERRGWTPHRLRRLHEILATAWGHAIHHETASDNPCAHIPKPGARRRELHIPTHTQIDDLLAAVTGVEHLALRLAATLGIRRGEIVALQWRDIDLDAAEITIRRSLTYTQQTGVVEGDTKTGVAGHRVLAIDPDTRNQLAEWKTAQAVLPRSEGVEQRWIFSDDAGIKPWRPDRLTHIFAAARKTAGATGVRLHDLRHYVATSMLQDGEPLVDVAAQLGHTSPATTSSVYTHFLPGRGRESVEKRAARIGRGGG